MIRYETTKAKLEREVDRIAPKWRTSTKEKTDAFRRARKYDEEQGSWSQVKPVYIAIQGGKCAYCERQMGRDEKSAIEHDVEHFRPKSAVKAWPSVKGTRHYGFPTGVASESGYYMLAYDLLNYIAACKKCNTPFKSNYFPIRARRHTRTNNFKKLATEQPLLIYPMTRLDADPEKLITFAGAIPLPAVSQGYNFERARVTIDFFALDTRDELLRERCEIIKSIYIAFDDLKHPDKLRRAAAEQTIGQIEHPRLPHRNCARCFLRLCQTDHDMARQHCQAAIDYLDSFAGK